MEWIRTNTVLPEPEKPVLVSYLNSAGDWETRQAFYRVVGKHSKKQNHWVVCMGLIGQLHDPHFEINYWMPLPEHPK